jgi:hypothetical protein
MVVRLAYRYRIAGHDARGVILIENAETFRHLVPLTDAGWVVLHVPGGPPPAETDLARRLHALAPGRPSRWSPTFPTAASSGQPPTRAYSSSAFLRVGGPRAWGPCGQP